MGDSSRNPLGLEKKGKIPFKGPQVTGYPCFIPRGWTLSAAAWSLPFQSSKEVNPSTVSESRE